MQSEKRHLTCVKLLDVKLTKRLCQSTTASFVVRKKYSNVKKFINVGFSKITSP